MAAVTLQMTVIRALSTDKPKRILALFFVLLILIVSGNGCSNINTNIPVTPPGEGIATGPDQGTTISPTKSAVEETHVANISGISNIISNIISHPDQYVGRQVEIVGYYRGWDLLKEVQGTPPVTRSDWVIADNSGAVYVTGIAPQNFNPASPQDTSKVICLVATVEQNQNGVYLQAISVELVSTE